ncbi:hypothetical protein QBC39DRAFT_418408 [Podospora conica]|nr:hypothetical protein QBC39DRAFT_418408 [Schizothecium conicum]
MASLVIAVERAPVVVAVVFGKELHQPRILIDSVGRQGVGAGAQCNRIMLAVLAMKKRWKNAGQKAGKPTDRPNMVMSSTVQVCWEKAARYFEVDEKAQARNRG